MALTPEEQKAIIQDAKSDTARNHARMALVRHYELMADAIAQQLPPWDRRWLEFAAVDDILATFMQGDPEFSSLLAARGVAGGHDLGDRAGGDLATGSEQIHRAIDATGGQS